MKKNIILSLIIFLLIGVTASTKKQSFVPVAVVELFTSQGCSSCPAADRLLAKAMADAKNNGQPILALSFHVDYWNRLGWKDPFSEKEYSERQSNYANLFHLSSVYTPQAIVNGAQEFVGSDEAKLTTAIKKSLRVSPATQFKFISAELQNNLPKVKFTLEGDYKGCNINVALVSLSETTFIKRGENEGVTLTNENIVRQFVSVRATENGEIDLNSSPLPATGHRAIIAYIQGLGDMKIVGGVMTDLK